MTAPALPILPDYLAPDLDVVFVGAAPSLSSEQVGHYYAGPTNKFWRLLHQVRVHAAPAAPAGGSPTFYATISA